MCSTANSYALVPLGGANPLDYFFYLIIKRRITYKFIVKMVPIVDLMFSIVSIVVGNYSINGGRGAVGLPVENLIVNHHWWGLESFLLRLFSIGCQPGIIGSSELLGFL